VALVEASTGWTVASSLHASGGRVKSATGGVSTVTGTTADPEQEGDSVAKTCTMAS